MLPRFSGSRNTASTSAGGAMKQKPETPRSPLMSVAHSVRSKLSKLGRLGRSHDSATSSSIKGSRSMSSMRPAAPRRADSDTSYKMAKSHSMEAGSSKESKLRPPQKITLLRGSPSREEVTLEEVEKQREELEKPHDNVEEPPMLEENIKKQIAITQPTFRHAHTSIVLRDPTSTTSTILAVEETIILPLPEMTKPTDLAVEPQPIRREFSGLAGSPDDRAEAEADIAHARDNDELQRDLLDEQEDEIPMDIGMSPGGPLTPDVAQTPMSETSTLYLQPIGQPEVEPLRLKRGQPRTESIASSGPSVLDLVAVDGKPEEPLHLQKIRPTTALEKARDDDIAKIFKQVAAFCMSQPKTQSIVGSEASTLYLLPLGDDEGTEPLRLKKLHPDGTETLADTPGDVQKMLKDVALFCRNQPRTGSICLSDASSIHLLPIGAPADEAITIKKIRDPSAPKALPPAPEVLKEEEERDVLKEIAVFCWAQPRRDSIGGSSVSSLCLMPIGGGDKVHLKKLHPEESPMRELASPDDVGRIFQGIAACCLDAPRTDSIAVSEVSSLYLAPLNGESTEALHLKKLTSEQLEELQRRAVESPVVAKRLQELTRGPESEKKRSEFMRMCLDQPEVESLLLSETSTLLLQPLEDPEGELLRLKKIHNKLAPRRPDIRPFQMDDSVLTIDTTPMSEASTLLYTNVGREHEEANMLRLRKVRDALEKHIEEKRKTTDKKNQDPMLHSETSTLMLVPIDDEQAEPLRLKKIRNLKSEPALRQQAEEAMDEAQVISPCSSNGPLSTDSNRENVEPLEKKESQPPVFHVPAPPKERIMVEHRGTSPLKKRTETQQQPIPVEQPRKSTGKLHQSASMREPPVAKQEAPKKAPRTPLTARSLKNFLLKKDKHKVNKPLSTSVTMPLSPRQNLHLRLRQDAPLAESESTVIENSPHVELPPLGFKQWSQSPRGRRSVYGMGPNWGSPGIQFIWVPHRARQVEVRSTQEPGLIDDEIRDQPMLVGDSFSTSTSLDQIAGLAMVSNLSTIYSPGGNHKQIEASLAEVEAMRAQLMALQSALAQTPESPPQNKGQIGCCELARENDVLRRQLSEKDRLISQLREQLAITKLTH
ncbi:unnamed protein product, partial [Mesorhabditis spiculigera]